MSREALTLWVGKFHTSTCKNEQQPTQRTDCRRPRNPPSHDGGRLILQTTVEIIPSRNLQEPFVNVLGTTILSDIHPLYERIYTGLNYSTHNLQDSSANVLCTAILSDIHPLYELIYSLIGARRRINRWIIPLTTCKIRLQTCWVQQYYLTYIPYMSVYILGWIIPLATCKPSCIRKSSKELGTTILSSNIHP